MKNGMCFRERRELKSLKAQARQPTMVDRENEERLKVEEKGEKKKQEAR